jgi:hypothetical protein
MMKKTLILNLFFFLALTYSSLTNIQDSSIIASATYKDLMKVNTFHIYEREPTLPWPDPYPEPKPNPKPYPTPNPKPGL